MPLPIAELVDRDRFPKRPVVIYPAYDDPHEFEVQIPTETGDLAIINIRQRGWPQVDVDDRGRPSQYEFTFTGELIDIAPEGITAAIQLVFLALRDHRCSVSGLR